MLSIKDRFPQGNIEDIKNWKIKWREQPVADYWTPDKSGRLRNRLVPKMNYYTYEAAGGHRSLDDILKDWEKVDKKVRTKWIDILRSGEYDKKEGGLLTFDSDSSKGGFCCLGVFADAFIEGTWEDENYYGSACLHIDGFDEFSFRGDLLRIDGCPSIPGSEAQQFLMCLNDSPDHADCGFGWVIAAMLWLEAGAPKFWETP